MTRKYGWAKNVLALRIQDQTYEKTLLGQKNFEQTLPESIKNQAKLAVRDEYTFDFLELGEEHGERELERAINEDKTDTFSNIFDKLAAFLLVETLVEPTCADQNSTSLRSGTRNQDRTLSVF